MTWEVKLEVPVNQLLEDYAGFIESSLDHVVNSVPTKLWRDQVDPSVLVGALLWRNWIESATAQTLRSARLGIKNARNSAPFLYFPIPAEPTQRALLFLFPVVSNCLQLSPFIALWFPTVANCSFLSSTVSGCRSCCCGFLWPCVASCGLLWPFEAFCGIESHRRNLSRVSPIVQICPQLSQTIRLSPILSLQQLFSVPNRRDAQNSFLLFPVSRFPSK